MRKLILVIFFAAALAAQSTPDPVAAGFDRFYRGDVPGAYTHFREIADRSPDNLAAAAGVLVALAKRAQDDVSLQKELEERLDRLIEKAESRYDHNKSDRDALFYLAYAYLARAEHRFDTNKGVWGAARDGAKAKNYSEAYVKLDPARGDAYLVLGTYNYYVDIAPSFVRVLRIFLFLPGGNRREGLQQIERAARDGQYFAASAQDRLVDIYSGLEGRAPDALRLAETLEKKYPENPDFQLITARLYAHPMMEDYRRAAEKCRTVVTRAEQGHLHYQGGVRYNALLRLAGLEQQQWQLERAVAVLTPVIDAQVSQPRWVMPRFLLTRSSLRAQLNDSNAPEDARRVLNQSDWKRWHDGAQRQLKWMEERRHSGEAAVFQALIPGNRLTAERRWDEARESYQKAGQKFPGDWQVVFRQASLDFARNDLDQAAAGFNRIAGSTAKIPAWIKAGALLQLARIDDLRGRRDQALQQYKKVVDNYEHEGAAQAARVGLITPYRRPAPAAPSPAISRPD